MRGIRRGGAEVVNEGVDHGAAVFGAGGVDDDVGVFVDDEDVVVFVEDVEGDRVGLDLA